MKALITSGGRGTRLRPITHTSNKHLIPIANKPMIYFALEAVAAAGIREVGLVINPDTGAVIQKALGDGERWGVRLSYILQEAPLGLAHVVKISQAFIGDAPFLFYLGDNIMVGGVARFIHRFQAEGQHCHLVLAKVRDPQRFGVAEIQGGRIVGIVEKPACPKSEYAVTGIYLYTAQIFEAVNAIRPSARGELEISDAHHYLIEKGYVVGYSEITGWWKDTGKPEDLLDANRLVLDQLLDNGEADVKGEVDRASTLVGRVIIGEGARIVRSHIRGPAIIGEGTVIDESYVGPFTSIAPRCTIHRSELEYSIVMEDTRIIEADMRIEQSIMGRGVTICRGHSRPKTHKFIIGDQSTIELA